MGIIHGGTNPVCLSAQLFTFISHWHMVVEYIDQRWARSDSHRLWSVTHITVKRIYHEDYVRNLAFLGTWVDSNLRWWRRICFSSHRGNRYLGLCNDNRRSKYIFLSLVLQAQFNGGQIFTGRMPFSYIRNDLRAVLAVMAGERPKRWPQIKDDIWETLERCWNVDPIRRPSMKTLLKFFALQSNSVAPKVPRTRL